MVDMASKKQFQAVLCPTQLFKWKLICTFNQHGFSYHISNRLQFNPSLFSHKLFKILLHWHTFFFNMCNTLKTRVYTQIPMHMSSVDLYKGQVSLASRLNWLCFTRNETKVHWQSNFLLSLSLQVVLYLSGALFW